MKLRHFSWGFIFKCMCFEKLCEIKNYVKKGQKAYTFKKIA